MPELKSNLKVPNCCKNVPEVPTPKHFQFSGTLPPWLKCTIFGNGPGVFDLEKGSVKHWMDGFSMTTKFVIDGKLNCLKFTSKYVYTSSFKKAVAAKKPIDTGYGTPAGGDEHRGFFSKLKPFTPNDVTDNGIGRVTLVGPSFYIFADSPTVFELNPTTLTAGSPFSVHKTFGLNSISPEILTDAETGDIYIVGTKINPTFHYVVLKLPKHNSSKRLQEHPKFSVVGSIASRWKFGPCGLRCCFTITKNYIVFIEVPCIVNLMRVAGTWIKNYTMLDWIDWFPQDKTRFYVMSKATGKVSKVEYLSTHAFIVVDIVNAYEDGEKIIIDLCTLPNTSVFEAMSISNMRSLTTPKDYKPCTMERFTIPIISEANRKNSDATDAGQFPSAEFIAARARRGSRAEPRLAKIIITPECLNESVHGYDSGVINSNYASKKHSFVYSVAALPSVISKSLPLTSTQAITKLHLNVNADCSQSKRKVTEWRSQSGFIASKPVFVANPDLKTEDDGVLISHMTHISKKNCDFLVVIETLSMKEIARVEFKDNCPVPAWFHGSYINSLL